MTDYFRLFAKYLSLSEIIGIIFINLRKILRVVKIQLREIFIQIEAKYVTKWHFMFNSIIIT